MSEWLQKASEGMAEVVAEVAPGVVRVAGRKRLAATGIAWDAHTIVTASHVIRRDYPVKIGLADGTHATATLSGRDEHTDIAILRTEATLTPAALADSGDSLKVGQITLALGRPGERVQATFGIISAIGTGSNAGIIQTDVIMYPGFSGGPLVSAGGRVVGMNTSGFRSGVSIAVDLATVRTVADTLIQHGKMQQGWLGVGVQPVRLPEAVAAETGQETGLIVVSVESGSPAEASGVMVGDVLIALDEATLPHIDALTAALRGNRIGQSATLKLSRGGALTTVGVTIGEKPA